MNPIVYISYVKADETLAVKNSLKLEKYHIPYFLGKDSISSQGETYKPRLHENLGLLVLKRFLKFKYH